MKIRHGFVSNSSTSSFIIIFPAEDFEELISKMEPLAAKIINDVVIDEKVIGIDAKVLVYSSGEDNNLEPHDLAYELQLELEKEFETIIEDDASPFCEMLYDALAIYGNLVKKHDKGFYHSEYH